MSGSTIDQDQWAPGFYSRGCSCEDCAETACDIERVEPGWNVQTDSGEVFVSDSEIAELRDKLDGGDIQAARLIAERYSAAYADGFSAGVELGESRAAVDAAATVAAAAPDLAPGAEFALEMVAKELQRVASKYPPSEYPHIGFLLEFPFGSLFDLIRSAAELAADKRKGEP